MRLLNNTKLLCTASFLLGASVVLFLPELPLPSLESYLNARGLREDLPSSAAQPNQKVEKVAAYGKIEAIEIPIAKSDGNFPDQDERLRPPKWVFDGLSESSLCRFLKSCDLRPREKRLLLDKRLWTVNSNGCVITPSSELIWALSHETRGRIYSILAKNPVNYPQYFPFRFALTGFDDKFKQSKLPQEEVERIRSLTYTNSGYLCFADLQTAGEALTRSEFNDLIGTLCTVPAYLLRLQVDKDSDIASLVKYWGKGGREKLIAPFLSSLARVPGGGSINVSYLLPPFPRLRLYTYPDAWNHLTATKEDCLYTALNFFNDSPDAKLLEQEYRDKVWRSEYAPIKDEGCLGDLITLLDAQDRPFHTCVYIADGFVFTKNGINPRQPWVLMKITDMLAVYESIEKARQIVFLRRKTSSVD